MASRPPFYVPPIGCCAECRGTEIDQWQPFTCLACAHSYRVRCSEEEFWMDVHTIGPTPCPACRSEHTQLVPCRIEYHCRSCNCDGARTQGI